METPARKAGHNTLPSSHGPLGLEGLATGAAPLPIAKTVVPALSHPEVMRMEIPIRPDRVWEVLFVKGMAG